jgi:FkbM family methyltransferase
VLKEKIARLPNYVKRFGAFHGLRLSMAVSGEGGNVDLAAQPVSVPGFDAPIWLRPNRSDHSIFWQCIVRDQYDFGKFKQTEELMRRATAMRAAGQVPLILDCGGNIGLSIRTFARDFPDAHIICVEPDDANMRVLRQNAESVGDRVTIVQGGIASRSGYCRVINRDRGSAGLMTEYCDAGDEGALRTYTVDDLVAMVPGGQPWIVKLDIEGAQAELFSTNTDWVGRADVIVLEPDDWSFTWSGSTVNFFKALSAHKFDYLLDGELILCYRHV